MENVSSQPQHIPVYHATKCVYKDFLAIISDNYLFRIGFTEINIYFFSFSGIHLVTI